MYTEKIRNHEIILSIAGVPAEWAEHSDTLASPPRREHWQDYADFCSMLIDRYCLEGVEIWNEPDGPLYPGEELERFLGGWGADGGAAYGEFAQYVAVALADKDCRVLVGAFGWALDSDFVTDFAGTFVSPPDNCALSYHSYSYDWWQMQDWDKLERISTMLSGLYDLPQIVTETSLLHASNVSEDPGFLAAQREYLRYIVVNRPDAVIKIVWYSLADNGWRSSDLVYREPKPVYKLWRDLLDAGV